MGKQANNHLYQIMKFSSLVKELIIYEKKIRFSIQINYFLQKKSSKNIYFY